MIDGYLWLVEGFADSRAMAERLRAMRVRFHAGARRLWQCADLRLLRGGGPGEVSRDYTRSLVLVAEYIQSTLTLLDRTSLGKLAQSGAADVLAVVEELGALAEIVQPIPGRTAGSARDEDEMAKDRVNIAYRAWEAHEACDPKLHVLKQTLKDGYEKARFRCVPPELIQLDGMIALRQRPRGAQ